MAAGPDDAGEVDRVAGGKRHGRVALEQAHASAPHALPDARQLEVRVGGRAERGRQRDQQFELLAARSGGEREDTVPAGQPLERDLQADPRGSGQMTGVGGETIRDVDHRRRAVRGEPLPRGDAGLGVGVAPPQEAAGPCRRSVAGERKRRTAETPRNPHPIARLRTGAAHGPLDDAEHAHVHEVLLGPHEIATEHLRAHTLRGVAHTAHDL